MAGATEKEKGAIPTPKLKLLQSERVKIPEVCTSKMTIDDHIASFKTSFDLRTLKQQGIALEQVTDILNRVADMSIVPYQQQAKFQDPNQGNLPGTGGDED